MKQELDVNTNDDILFSFILTRLLFTDNYLENLKSFDKSGLMLVFNNIIANIYNNEFFTKFDQNVNDRLYNILNYFREVYKDSQSCELINDAIAILNDQDNNEKESAFISQFNIRYDTILNRRYRNQIIKYNYEGVKELVRDSILNDLPFFYDLEHLKGTNINETYGNQISYVSNITYLLSVFPEVLVDETMFIKLYNLLAYNIDSNKEKIITDPLLYSSSALTMKKLTKIIKKK